MTVATWEHCPQFAEAVGEGIGTYDDPVEWRGPRRTPTAPCGHRAHNYNDAGERHLFLGQIPPQRTSYGLTILLALNSSGKHIYEGTVGRVERARRRKKNKAARAARRLNR